MKALHLFTVVAIVFSMSCKLAAQHSCQTAVSVMVLTEKPMNSLTISDFHATLKGHELAIRKIEPLPSTRRFVFVLDRSGSMTNRTNQHHSNDPSLLVNQALDQMISAIPDSDSVAFTAFAGRESERTEFMQPVLAKAWIAEILAWKPQGKGDSLRTPLWDNIHSALSMLTPHKSGDVIVVISDGGDNQSKVSSLEIQDELMKAGVPVLGVVLIKPSAATQEEREGPLALIDLTEATGGTALVGDLESSGFRRSGNLPTLPVLPIQLISQLAYQFLFDLDMPDTQKPQKFQLSVKPETGAKVSLFYPRTLYPCSATP
jgi:hypothetical protein